MCGINLLSVKEFLQYHGLAFFRNGYIKSAIKIGIC